MQQGVATVPRDRFAVVVHVLIERPGPAGRELFLLRRARTGFMQRRGEWYAERYSD
jgi:hypothetical protein